MTAKTPFNGKALPGALSRLPVLRVTSRPPANAAEAARTDVAYNVKSLDDLVRAFDRFEQNRYADTKRRALARLQGTRPNIDF